jgi:cell division protein FtsI (penicillin-binding protein 3)
MIVFVLASAALGLRLLDLQVFDRDRFVSWGRDQRLQTEPVVGERGRLLDRNGEALAVSLPQPFIAADPGMVTDPDAAAALLAPVIGRDVEDVRAALVEPGRFVYLRRPADEAQAEEVRSLDLPFLIVRDEPRRFHPSGGRMARGVLGVVGVDNQGLSGVELQFDDLLAGTPGQLVLERSIDGRTIPDSVREAQPAVEGADMHLTIERSLQFEVERALAQHVAETGSIGGVVVIADPATGDVLAMASVVDTEEAGIVTTSDNRAVTWIYEPASVMKAMTFAAVLDRGIAGPNTTRIVEDEIQIYDDTFSDESDYEPEPMTVAEILRVSSNTGTIGWADDLGDELLHDYMVDFGFGSLTGLGFPGEAAGILDHVSDWSGTSFATIAIGQGVAVTPLQMLAAYNVLANDGVYVTPRLVMGTTDPDGELEPAAAPATRRVIGARAATEMSALLTNVVDSGTAQAASVPGYRVAAKTGTARKVQEGGGYEDASGAYHYASTVAGYFPADEPRFSMIVVLDEPDAIYASRTAAPLFGQPAAWTLRHFQISPTTSVVVEPAPTDVPVDDTAKDDGVDAGRVDAAGVADAGDGDGEGGSVGAVG